jgi:hypothetical protein
MGYQCVSQRTAFAQLSMIEIIYLVHLDVAHYLRLGGMVKDL